MLKFLRQKTDSLLIKAKLKPLTLAEKCRLQFGAAVLFSLVLALLIPYFWMGKLTEKNALDSGRAVANTIYERHFRIEDPTTHGLPKLNEGGLEKQHDYFSERWIRLEEGIDPVAKGLSQKQREAIRELSREKGRSDASWTVSEKGGAMSHYVQVVRAGDACISCHNPEGTASPFNKNELVGAIVVQTPARETARTKLMNQLWIIVAGLLAGTGAMIAFYTIVQRIILRPIRQLRALVRNISEGNMDARSSIRTGDEYERLSEAFNNMLDGLQESQEKLRQANIQLDGKIAQLSDRNIELFKANKLKSEFLANISHEVRTPLNAILGFAELLKEKPADNIDKSKRYAQNIITSGRNLLNLINDLLDLAKAEAGKMKMNIEKTDLRMLCNSLAAFFTPLSDEKQIRIRVNVSDDLAAVQTDPGKVQQILYNLLSNAIKFTPEQGTIQISAKNLDDLSVRISVSDTGPGIPFEQQERIFEKFRQVDGSITRSGTGTGLGLAICRELCNLLAANISVESEPAKGSTFHLDLPVNLREAKEEQAEE